VFVWDIVYLHLNSHFYNVAAVIIAMLYRLVKCLNKYLLCCIFCNVVYTVLSVGFTADAVLFQFMKAALNANLDTNLISVQLIRDFDKISL